MQHIAILSVNHQRTPVSVREKVAFSADTLTDNLHQLHQISTIKACVIVATCNRAEIIAITDADKPQQILSNYLTTTHKIKTETIRSYLDYFEDDAAINHLCCVATGLDSLVLGEPQILGQLKDAYHLAKQAGTLNKLLEKLFQHTFSTAKKVRTNTQIGASPVSVAYYGVRLSESIFTDLSKQTVLLIGAGQTIELCAQHLSQKGIKNIIVANRSDENAQKIASVYGAQTVRLKQLSSIIHRADIIISSTAASVPIIGKGLIETALKQRKHKPIFILDMAVPRDIEPEVAQLGDVFLYTIDDLQQVVNDNIDSRQKEKTLAQDIIKMQNQKFNDWLHILPSEKVMATYQQQALLIKTSAVETAVKKLNNGGNAEKIIDTLAQQLTNKLLHALFQNIKQTAVTPLKQSEKQ